MRNAVALGAHISLTARNVTLRVTDTAIDGQVTAEPLAGGPSYALKASDFVPLSKQGGSLTPYRPGRLVTIGQMGTTARMIVSACTFKGGEAIVTVATPSGRAGHQTPQVEVLPFSKLIPGDLVHTGLLAGLHQPELHLVARIGNLHGDGSDAVALDDGRIFAERDLILVSGALPGRERVPAPGEAVTHPRLGACRVLELQAQEEGPVTATVAHAGGIDEVAFDTLARSEAAIAAEAQALEDELDAIAIDRYREEWGEGPFETADCVAFWKEQVLLIKRKNRPQKGRWGTPGGFLDKNEPPYASAIRELIEETLFRLGKAYEGRALADVLKDAVVGTFRQEGKHRDPRAEINTTVTVVDLDRLGGIPRPEIQAADDAEDAGWKELAALPGKFYADHGDIVAKAAKLAGRTP